MNLKYPQMQILATIFYSANNLTTGKTIIANLNINTKYFWHVRRLNPILSAWSSTRTFTQLTIASLGNLSLWLKADSGVTVSNGNVLTWNDLSINQYNLTQATAIRQPTEIQNFYDDKFAIKFDGNDFFEIPNFAFGLNNSAFVVGKKNSGSVYSRYIGTYSNHMEICTDAIGLSGNVVASYSTNIPTVLSISRTPGLTKIFQNDSIIATSYLNLIGLSGGSLYIGRSSLNNNADFLTGEIAEVILCTTLLNDSIIEIVNHYLMDKYSKELYLGNDTTIVNNFCPLTLNANSGFTDYLWSTGETNASITVSNSGIFWVQAKDYFGRIKYDTIQVNYPTVNQLNTQILCNGAQVIWNTGLNNTYTHLWQDNSNLNQITINTSNQYFVKITDSNGCTFYSDTVEVTIDNFAVTNSLGNDTNLCFGNSIQLQNYYSPNANYLWSNGSSNDTLVISNSGIYWVEVSNQNNCILRDTITVNIIGNAPNAIFTSANGCIGSAVTFTDLSTPPSGETISQWLWDFGDGVISNLQNNVHVYDSAGLYNVSLKVILQSGCGAVINQNLTVFETPILSYTAFNLCNEKLTEFNNTSNLFGGTLQSVSWNFGDPSSATNTASSTQAFHSYSAFGDYTLGLTIQTTEGCIDSAQWLIGIKPSPIADFNFSKICVGDTTIFTDNSYIAFPWQNSHREWLFPNGDTSFAYQPTYAFNAAGTYQITLNIQSSNGCRDTITKNITLFNKPIANLTYQKNCVGEATILNDSSSCINCQITDYSWFIDSNLIGNGANINYLFSDTGFYAVSLVVTNNAGCISIIDTFLTITEPPTANFTINSNFGSTPFMAEFNNLSLFANSYIWDFGDGSFSQNMNPVHTYNDTGSFTILLSAFNNDNCLTTYSQVLQLKPKNIDLVIFELETNLVNDFIENTLVIFNKSTSIITGFEVIISNKANILIKENYDKTILPGEFKTIKLSTKIKQVEGFNSTDVLCVEIININEGPDSDLSNNNKCNSISANNFKLLNLYPIPTLEDMYIRFLCPSKDEIFIEITDLAGNIVLKYTLIAPAGYNEYHIPTLGLAAGSYCCKVNYQGIIQSKLFLKLSE